MKKIYLLVLGSIIALNLDAQTCDCKANFEWLKTTFETNDAGFDYYHQQKGETNYALLNNSIREKSKNINTVLECQKLLTEWLHFFRKEHIGLELANQPESKKKLSEPEIIKKFENWEKIDLEISEFEKYLKSDNLQEYEGVWKGSNYTLGVKRVNKEYIGFIIKADGVYWTERQVKFRINTTDNAGIYYMGDHSEKIIDRVDLFNNQYIRLGAYLILKKQGGDLKINPKIESYFQSINAHNPTLEKISDNTLLLRIPHMWIQFKPVIDSIISTNIKLLTSTENLIIDIRNNGGGGDFTYEAILPIIYTNPIRTIDAEFLSTKTNNVMLEYVVNDKNLDKELRDWAQTILDRAIKNPNQFVPISEGIITITKYNTIYQYPKNVAIVIDENVASASEQFLLDAKQSTKVKVFGTTTAGGLDLANVNETVSPSGEFILVYATSRSMRVPEMVIPYIRKG